MSLVGPRPEMPFLVDKYQPWQRKRFAVPQGITGWWQINGRSDRPMHLNTEDDLYYVQNYSIALDITILLRTISAVFSRKGAY
jgi:lipopolysaccharide/colanic/teichoic acid biosynthesis glycosyltransferase